MYMAKHALLTVTERPASFLEITQCLKMVTNHTSFKPTQFQAENVPFLTTTAIGT